MRTTTMTLLMTVVPSLLAAQSSATEPSPMQGFSAEGRVQAEATLQAARDRALPEQPLYAVMLEGQAKGATEAQILGAEQQALARLELAQEAIVRAGRTEPTDAETTRAAGLLAQGMTSAELSAVIQGIPSSQSLVLAFDAVASGGVDAVAGVGSTVGSVGSAGASASAASSVDVSGAGAPGSLSAAGSATASVSGGVLGR
jgi:type II secretory pathway pseudopilin PulG